MMNVSDKEVIVAIRNLFHYSLDPIGLKYEGLTPEEKKAVGSKKAFDELVKIVNGERDIYLAPRD